MSYQRGSDSSNTGAHEQASEQVGEADYSLPVRCWCSVCHLARGATGVDVQADDEDCEALALAWECAAVHERAHLSGHTANDFEVRR